MLKALRTPENCFQGLADYPFSENYLYVSHPNYEPLRMHYVDEGNKDAHTVLLLHGCPAWSYLYRKVIPVIKAAGYRVIVPDHIGCGKSDKLLHREDYAYQYYVQWLQDFIEQLGISDLTLVCQDWGGPIGLSCLARISEKFARVLLTNTLLPNCEEPPLGVENWPGEIIDNWVNYSATCDDLQIGQIIQGVTCTELDDTTLAAYDAPFPDVTYKQGMLGWPSLIPRKEGDLGIKENRETWGVIEQLNIPFMTAFSDKDPSTEAWEKVFQYRLRGAKDISHKNISNAGHMVQEDKGEELARIIVDFISS